MFFLVMMGFTLFQSLFPLYTHLEYGLTPAQNGIVMAVIGIMIALNQAFFLKRIWLKFFTELQIQIFFLALLVFINLGIAVGNWWLFCIVMVLFPFAQSTLRVVTVNEITEVTHEKERGEVLGVTQSLMFLASIVSPLLGGWLFELNSIYLWLFSAAMATMALGVFYVFACSRRSAEQG